MLSVNDVDAFRVAHLPMMQSFKTALNALLSQQGIHPVCMAMRLKRMPSIVHKLKRLPHLSLTTMQDIAGARVVVDTIQRLDRLVQLLQTQTKIIVGDCEFCLADSSLLEKVNYVRHPKESGYRSVHFIYRERSQGLLLELQVRTKCQHDWATAVEVIDERCASSYKTGQVIGQDLRQLLVLCSVMVAQEEKTTVLSSYQHMTQRDVYQAVAYLEKKVQLLALLEQASTSLCWMTPLPLETDYVLMSLQKSRSETLAYALTQEQASQMYPTFEKKAIDQNCVLVSVDRVEKLGVAYPNYFLEAHDFVEKLKSVSADPTMKKTSFVKN